MVLREAHLRLVYPSRTSAADVVGAALVGRDDLEPDAVDADERAAFGELADGRDVGLLVLMADEHTPEVGAAVGEESCCTSPWHGVLGVRDDRAADLTLGQPRRR